MICPFCRKEFAAKEAKKGCRACSSFGGCQKVKCPFCGYESPREPDYIEKIRNLKEKLRSYVYEKK